MSIDVPESRLSPAAAPATATAAATAPAASPTAPAAMESAATAAATAPAASPTAPAAMESAATAAAPATPSDFFADPRHRVVLLVKDVEGRQADIGNFFLTEEEFVMGCGVLHRQIHFRSSSRRGCSAGHCQRHSGDSQRGCGSLPTV